LKCKGKQGTGCTRGGSIYSLLFTTYYLGLQIKTFETVETVHILSENTGPYGASMKMRAFWDIEPCSLVGVYRRFATLMMEAISTSETLVYFNDSERCYIPENSSVKLGFSY
jgi:hypothetical protein